MLLITVLKRSKHQPKSIFFFRDDLLRSGVITPRPGKTKVYIGPPNAKNGSRKSKNPPGSIYLPVVGNGYLFNERFENN